MLRAVSRLRSTRGKRNLSASVTCILATHCDVNRSDNQGATMFNFFKSAPTIDYSDRVWIDAHRKLDGICDETIALTARGKAVMIVGFFDETLATLDSALRARGISFQRALSVDGSAGSRAPVWLLPASHLRSTGNGSHVGGEDPDLYVLFAEHHPLLSRDKAALEGVASLPFSSRILFYTALDDAIMNRFGGDRIVSLMKSLGHEENECIEHSMISSSIRKAQEKVEKKVRSETGARSAEEWFRVNLGD